MSTPRLAIALGITLLHAMPAPAEDDEDRVATARQWSGDTLQGRFREAGLAYPPGEIFLRAFKHEAEVELWAREKDEPFRKVATYAVTASSGRLGPKRREGDLQVPEGFYVINVFNPKSRFHLSLGLNYPNDSDRFFADPQKPGFDIYMHGGDWSVGCLPLGDFAIEEVYLSALDACAQGQTTIEIHIFPARMSGPNWTALAELEIAARPELREFWEQLRPAYDAFEQEKRPPRISVDADGRYRLVRGF
jgi:murein L,D-transpeptidase YafK